MTTIASSDVFIPAGPYCYQLLEVVNRLGQVPLLRSRPCSHFEKVGETSRCNLLGVQGDLLLDDSCKICGLNDDAEE